MNSITNKYFTIIEEAPLSIDNLNRLISELNSLLETRETIEEKRKIEEEDEEDFEPIHDQGRENCEAFID